MFVLCIEIFLNSSKKSSLIDNGLSYDQNNKRLNTFGFFLFCHLPYVGGKQLRQIPPISCNAKYAVFNYNLRLCGYISFI